MSHQMNASSLFLFVGFSVPYELCAYELDIIMCIISNFLVTCHLTWRIQLIAFEIETYLITFHMVTCVCLLMEIIDYSVVNLL